MISGDLSNFLFQKNKRFVANFIAISLLLFFAAACNTVSPTSATTVIVPTVTPANTLNPIQTDETPTSTPQPKPSTSAVYSPTPIPLFTFIVNGDSSDHAGPGEMDTPQFFRGAVESIATIPDVRFMISVGDINPAPDTRWTIDRYLGQDFLWFPVVGNHDLYTEDLDWLHRYDYDPNGPAEPDIVNHGPDGCEQTTYSFDYLNAHFVVLNVYCDVDNEKRTDGAIVDHLYNWLKNDLDATQKEHIFVFGHEPAFPQPDATAGIIRHLDDSLDKYPVTRDRFWNLLKEYHVLAYLNGHTHSYSVVDIEGVWQIDTAHSMGARTQSTRSTYIAIHVTGNTVTYDTYRVNNVSEKYELADSGILTDQAIITPKLP